MSERFTGMQVTQLAVCGLVGCSCIVPPRLPRAAQPYHTDDDDDMPGLAEPEPGDNDDDEDELSSVTPGGSGMAFSTSGRSKRPSFSA